MNRESLTAVFYRHKLVREGRSVDSRRKSSFAHGGSETGGNVGLVVSGFCGVTQLDGNSASGGRPVVRGIQPSDLWQTGESQPMSGTGVGYRDSDAAVRRDSNE